MATLIVLKQHLVGACICPPGMRKRAAMSLIRSLLCACRRSSRSRALIVLTQHLEGARFQAFWAAADACRDVVVSVPGYYEAIRAYILTAITATCQKKASRGAARGGAAPGRAQAGRAGARLIWPEFDWLCDWVHRGVISRQSPALSCTQIEGHKKEGWTEAQMQGGRSIVVFPEMCAPACQFMHLCNSSLEV